MQKPRGTIGWTLAAVLVMALAATSFKALAEPAFNRHVAGSYRVVMLYRGHELPHVATFTSDGAVISTFVPLRCGEPGEDPNTQTAASFTTAHGSWEIALQKGRPVLLFNLLSDEWTAPVVLNPDDTVESNGAYAGPVQVVGAAVLTTGVVKGQSRIAFSKNSQGGCGQVPIVVDFTAERIPAAADPKDNVSQ